MYIFAHDISACCVYWNKKQCTSIRYIFVKFDIQSCDFSRRLRRFSATTSQQIELLLGMMRKMIYQHFQSTWLKKCGKKEMVKSSLKIFFQRFEVDDESGEAVVKLCSFSSILCEFSPRNSNLTFSPLKFRSISKLTTDEMDCWTFTGFSPSPIENFEEFYHFFLNFCVLTLQFRN